MTFVYISRMGLRMRCQRSTAAGLIETKMKWRYIRGWDYTSRMAYRYSSPASRTFRCVLDGAWHSSNRYYVRRVSRLLKTLFQADFTTPSVLTTPFNRRLTLRHKYYRAYRPFQSFRLHCSEYRIENIYFIYSWYEMCLYKQ